MYAVVHVKYKNEIKKDVVVRSVESKSVIDVFDKKEAADASAEFIQECADNVTDEFIVMSVASESEDKVEEDEKSEVDDDED